MEDWNARMAKLKVELLFSLFEGPLKKGVHGTDVWGQEYNLSYQY